MYNESDDYDSFDIDTNLEKVVANVLEKRISKISEGRKKISNRLNKFVKAPPFVKISDKISFVAGVVFLLITEYVILVNPKKMHQWYILTIVPLLITRFLMYHKAKFHYFMLDFCYFSQVLLIFYLVYYPNSRILFQLVFAIANGPLLFAIIMWSNSLVFHDIDKMTSVLIHFLPSLVTYCLRWYPLEDNFLHVCETNDCVISWKNAVALPMYFYLFWQFSYVLKTEFIDKAKIEERDYMTSLRWMTIKKPHPIYQTIRKHQYKIKFGPFLVQHPSFLLVIIQILYTTILMVPAKFFYESQTVHCVALLIVFLFAIWNGANFYFEVFSKRYAQQIEKIISAFKEQEELEEKNKNKNNN
eukprot:TRINITY_DN2066_c0_g1_i1.p1 TRINITY_DN2066_c0_g1~~TRINITY_DN2066_c0_g1_i1.p1  ORF type:complete len:358 (+),score=59.38 TRINITY_DN2066_c0_g1_i1:41-1114(+)